MLGTDAKAVFLVVHNGFVARYLLRTDILPILRRSGARIVVLSQNADEAYFQAEMRAQGVIVEELRSERCLAYWRGSHLQRWLSLLRAHTLNRRCGLGLSTLDGYFANLLKQIRLRPWRERFPIELLRPCVWLARRSWAVRRVITELETRLFAGHIHRDLFERYRPVAVVTTSLGYFMPDQYLMREGRHHGAQVVAVILSWDNPSSRGMGGAPVDLAVAWHDAMREELIGYHDLPEVRVIIGGVPGFDVHHRTVGHVNREDILRSWGLDPGKKLIFLATKSPNQYPWNDEIVETIVTSIEEGRLGVECQLLVRLHPNYYRTANGRALFAEDRERVLRRTDRPFVRVSEPRILSQRLPIDMPEQEYREMAAILSCADVVVNLFSTVAVEAAIFDVPIVHVCFEGDPRRWAKERHDITFDLVQDHNRRVIEALGVRVAYDRRQLLEILRIYLADRSLDASGRAQIRENECGPYPGEAGRNVGEAIVRFMKQGVLGRSQTDQTKSR